MSDNTAGTGGGGMITYGHLTLWQSTISGNRTVRSVGGGGGISGGGPIVIVNSTISGNTAVGGGGGLSSGGAVSLLNSTVVDNHAPFGSGGGVRAGAGASITFANTLVAGNTAASGANCAGTGLVALGHNLDGGNTCGFGNAGDLSNTDPGLGPLQDNGGPTPTHALLPSSPAINAGTGVGCPTTDQRGWSRPQGGECAIGAFEARAGRGIGPLPSPRRPAP